MNDLLCKICLSGYIRFKRVSFINASSSLTAPLKPVNVSVQQSHFDQDILTLNISWARPRQLPDNYTLYIFDLHVNSNHMKYIVDGSANHYYIPNITILGASFEVHLVAYTEGGRNATVLPVDKIDLQFWMLGTFR